MDENTNQRWQQLVDAFRLKKPGASPWDARLLESNLSGASHGERCTIAFLLNVWDPSEPWKCGKFDVLDAYGIWDEASRDAFLLWAIKPWWP